MKEVFRPIVNYESLYEVSNKGRVMSSCNGKFMSLTPSRRHRVVHLTKNKNHAVCLVHRLVLRAFVGPCPEGMEVCHGPKNNGHLSNLSYGTRSQNIRDRYRDGIKGGARPVLRSDGVRFTSLTAAAKSVEGQQQNIMKCCKGIINYHKGFSWSYVYDT